MNFYSTRNRSVSVPFHEAIYMGPAADGGLFMPERIPLLDSKFFSDIESKSIIDIGFSIIRPYVTMPANDLHDIIANSFTFSAPLVQVQDGFKFLELFHGPTLAFKDFGARFMAHTMSYYKPNHKEVNILVATSGDTGGAVASAFSGLEGFNVYILYPKGKVSPLQQRQLTTWESNIKAIEVEGSFDDCQRMVKSAFADHNLRSTKIFGSANSINIARLLPQMVYYFEAYRQTDNKSNLQFIVPSGNFGNLTAGILAKKMGLPIAHFIASTNANDIVPTYLSTSEYHARVSRETLSNAMDVGDPSNFARMKDIYQGADERSTWNNMKAEISQHVVSDSQTLANMNEVWTKYGYLIDPHTAVAYDAAKHVPGNNVIVSTAHWSKFLETVKKAIGNQIPEVPKTLLDLMDKKENYLQIGTEYEELKDIIGK